jgi:GTPase
MMTESTDAGSAAARTRCGFVALLGVTNAGKSTLMNRLVGSKVSIVSHKVQTTRALVRGIAMTGDEATGEAQVIFVDMPGIFTPKRRLDHAMISTAWGGAGDADVVALLVDARIGLNADNKAILAKLKQQGRRKILVLNKIDLVLREELLALAKACNDEIPFEATFMISAETGSGCAHFLDSLGKMMSPGPMLYPRDQVADAPLRQLAAEITREKLFERLHQELPYESTVETEQWLQKADGSVRIEQIIFVTRESQRKIVLGKGGQTIKAIGQSARRDIAEAADCPVHLFLFVKVRENWADDPERYREMGIEFPKG